MFIEILVMIIIPFIVVCVGVSYFQDTTTNRDINDPLG
jgi:D-alanyl-lipoteichoic acid acyltransferase DltB (MBOAT superfamily)